MNMNPHLTSGKQYVDAAVGRPDPSTTAHLPECERCQRVVIEVGELLKVPGWTPERVEQFLDTAITSTDD